MVSNHLSGVTTPVIRTLSVVIDKTVPLWDHKLGPYARREPQGGADLLRGASRCPQGLGPLVQSRQTSDVDQVRGGKTVIQFNTADFVAPFVVFDIGGNKYRLIAEMNFSRSVLFIRGIMTHKEYVKGAWKS